MPACSFSKNITILVLAVKPKNTSCVAKQKAHKIPILTSTWKGREKKRENK